MAQYHTVYFLGTVPYLICILTWYRLGCMSWWSSFSSAFVFILIKTWFWWSSQEQNTFYRSSTVFELLKSCMQHYWTINNCWENNIFLYVHRLYYGAKKLGATFLTANSIFHPRTIHVKIDLPLFVKGGWQECCSVCLYNDQITDALQNHYHILVSWSSGQANRSSTISLEWGC